MLRKAAGLRTWLGLRKFVVCLLVCLASDGCRHPRRHPSESTIHSITQELAAAASRAAPPGSTIKMKKSASSEPHTSDSLLIQLDKPERGTSVESAADKVLQAMAAIATRHRLVQDPPQRSGNSLGIRLRAGGIVTHEITIEEEGARAQSAAPPFTAVPTTARLAIILDDLGGDKAAAEAVLALGYPLTVSILPGHPYSAEIAAEAHQHGLEVMLHLPMQAMGNEPAEPGELRPGMDSALVAQSVDQLLQSVPGAVGVNNHQGSQATADAQLMAELMPVLRARQLFYIDSRTTAATVAYAAAQNAGLPCAFRNVPFLDDVPEIAKIERQLAIALRGAREKGEAIAIGHPHPQTIAALSEMLPEARSKGVQLVYASKLVH